MTKTTTKKTIPAAFALTLAALAAAAPERLVLAQEAGGSGDAAQADDLAAETAFLKAYFVEREAKDPAKAEPAYAAVAETKGARREIVAKALLGRWRCLTSLGRAADASKLGERLRAEFKDVAEVAAAVAPSPPFTGDVAADIEQLFDLGRGAEVARWGDRAVPYAAERLRRDNPTVVETAADVLAMINSDAAWAAVEAALRDPAVLHPAWMAKAVGRCPAKRSGVIDSALSHKTAPTLHEIAATVVLGGTSAVPTPELVARILGDPLARQALTKGNSVTDADAVVTIAALSSDDPEVRVAGTAHLSRGGSRPSNLVQRLQAPPPALLAHDDSVQAAVNALLNIPGGVQTLMPSAELIRASIRADRAPYAALLLLGTKYATSSADRPLLIDALRALTPKDMTSDWSLPDVDALVRILGTTPSAEDFRLLMERWTWGQAITAYLAKLSDAGALDDVRLATALRSLRVNSSGQPLLVTLDWVANGVKAGRLGQGAVNAYLATLDRPEVAGQAAQRLRTIAVSPQGSWQGAPAATYASDFRVLASWVRADAPKDRQDAAIDYLRGAIDAKQWNAADAVRDALTPEHPRFAELLDIAVRAKAPWVADLLDGWSRARSVAPRTLAWALPSARGADAVPALTTLVETCPADQVQNVFDAIATGFGTLGRPACAKLLLLAIERRGEHLAPVCNPANSPSCWVLRELAPDDGRAVALAALKSSSAGLRRWGAFLEYHLRDPSAWDALLAAAKDGSVDVRDHARGALKAIESDRLALNDIETGARVRNLLTAKGVDERRAGIAGAVATRATALVPELLRLAVEDPDADVRADARAALVALGSVPPAAPAK